MTDVERIVWAAAYGAAYIQGLGPYYARQVADQAVMDLRNTGGSP